MPDALSWQTLQAVATVLSGITVANGFRTDAGLKVDVEQLQQESGSGSRISLWLDVMNLTPGDLTTGREIELQLTAQAEVPADISDAQAKAHAAVADIIDAIPVTGLSLPFSGIKADVQSQAAQFLVRPDGASSTIGQVRLVARLRLAS